MVNSPFQFVLGVLDKVLQHVPKPIMDAIGLVIAAKILSLGVNKATVKTSGLTNSQGGMQMEMTKAYDVSVLAAMWKARGLEVAEETLKMMLDDTFDWLGQSAELSATPVDNLLEPLYPTIKAFVATQVDKIDGKVG